MIIVENDKGELIFTINSKSDYIKVAKHLYTCGGSTTEKNFREINCVVYRDVSRFLGREMRDLVEFETGRGAKEIPYSYKNCSIIFRVI